MVLSIAFLHSFLVLKSQFIVSKLFTWKMVMSMALCGKWLRLILAGGPFLACLPRGPRALMLSTCIAYSGHISVLCCFEQLCLCCSPFLFSEESISCAFCHSLFSATSCPEEIRYSSQAPVPQCSHSCSWFVHLARALWSDHFTGGCLVFVHRPKLK